MTNPSSNKEGVANSLIDACLDIVDQGTTEVSKGHESPLLIFVVCFALSLLGYFFDATWLMSLAGLFWMTSFFLTFLFFIGIHRNFDIIIQNIERARKGPQIAEAITLTDEERELRKKEVSEKFKQWLNGLEKVVRWSNKNTFTSSSIVVSLAHVVSVLHIAAATGNISNFFSFSKTSPVTYLFLVVLPLYGLICDKFFSKRPNYGRGVYIFTALQYYLGSVIFFSGLLGGREAIQAINILMREPWLFYVIDIWYYPDAYSHFLYKNMGALWFFLVYLFIPFYIALIFWREIDRVRRGEKALMPIWAMKMMVGISVYLVIMALLVAWQEGWIYKIYTLILAGIEAISQLFGESQDVNPKQ